MKTKISVSINFDENITQETEQFLEKECFFSYAFGGYRRDFIGNNAHDEWFDIEQKIGLWTLKSQRRLRAKVIETYEKVL